MAKYTTEVRSICETYAGLNESVGYDSIDEVISKSRTKIFDFDYPIFDTSYKPVLETKILLHYYTREIGEETVGLWKLRLKSKMMEIMPYYNQLYNSELLEFNPLYDTDYHKSGDRAGIENSEQNNTGKRNSQYGGQDVLNRDSERGGSDTDTINSREKYSEWNLYSDTPQGGIEGILGAEDEPSLEDNGYLTNARHILHDGDGTNSTDVTEYGATQQDVETTNYGKNNVTTDAGTTKFEGNTTEEYAEHVYGKMPGKSYPQLLKEFRDTFLNIDADIIKELANLFLNLW